VRQSGAKLRSGGRRLAIEDAKRDRLGDVSGADGRRAVEIGDRARDAEHAAVRARREREASHRRAEDVRASLAQGRDPLDLARRHRRVRRRTHLAAAPALGLRVAREFDARADIGRRFARGGALESRDLDGG
jgi:hypothetical protein